jgi:hypothetical protein
MQKLIIKYSVEHGDYETPTQVLQPFWFHCKQSALAELKFLVENQENYYTQFIFAGMSLTAEAFCFESYGQIEFTGADILTLEEWFEQEATK